MLPKFRLMLATIVAALLLGALGVSLFSTSRTASVFTIGLRSAMGSPIERALPAPPHLEQSLRLAASRRAAELDRLRDLPSAALPSPEEARSNESEQALGGNAASATREADAPEAGNAAPDPARPE
jgi:hypothetical protein